MLRPGRGRRRTPRQNPGCDGLPRTASHQELRPHALPAPISQVGAPAPPAIAQHPCNAPPVLPTALLPSAPHPRFPLTRSDAHIPPRTPSPTAERTVGGVGRADRTLPRPRTEGPGGGQRGGGARTADAGTPSPRSPRGGEREQEPRCKAATGPGGEGRAALTCGGAVRNEGGGLLLAGSFCRTARYI